MPISVALPIDDRRVAHDSYRDGLGLELVGDELAEDGLPEPLMFALADDAVLVLVPRDGFGFVSADHEVAGRGHSECVLGVSVASPAEVDALTERVRGAGATVKVEPADPGWGTRPRSRTPTSTSGSSRSVDLDLGADLGHRSDHDRRGPGPRPG